MWEEKEGEEVMANFVNGKYAGGLAMSGKKTFLGVPKNTLSSKPNMGSIDKATNRGKNEACIKKG